MHERIDEPVDTMVCFTGKGMVLRSFLWHNRSYGVDRTCMVHRVREGAEWLYFYAVMSGATNYRLSFSTRNLQWKLVDLYAEG